MSADFDVVSGNDEQQDAIALINAELAKMKAKVEEEATKGVTIADVAAAAFTALETCVAILGGPGKPNGMKVIEDFEQRARSFSEAFEEDE
jgi:hypothetical protein